MIETKDNYGRPIKPKFPEDREDYTQNNTSNIVTIWIIMFIIFLVCENINSTKEISRLLQRTENLRNRIYNLENKYK